ncbi:Uma2 family endonuclease [Cyanobium sp. ATX 6A2]|uniref:Uma2 family endonuclease n=1 Tax=Cyanobium sp. ATX 6A2 TaxID=2823700 RepID=UPI0020CE585A|nr:Uma2 family endonuclease [Cyanobium sp. ATX 6A2]MCP9888373.1 Uma2 family endonuclease [Cyanobium sp. ATX 6A2]
MLTLPPTLRLTPAEFAEVCASNPEAVLELDADGTLIEMQPTGGSTSARNTALLSQLHAWARSSGDWFVFDSSGGFLLPDGSIRSPDASVLRLERWRALSEAEGDGFPPLCPDLVVELSSPSDAPEALRRKMAAYRANGARLGWLLLPQSCGVEVWTAGTRAPQVLSDPSRLEAGEAFPGLVIDLQRIWEV